MTEITRHFTATTFVVHEGKVLLHRHPKQGLWLPPGGHIERDELPHHAAIREIEEETGLRLRLHSEAAADALGREMECPVVPQPAFILVEDINAFHQHIDFTYFALLGDEPVEASWSEQGFAWFSPSDLTMDGVPRNVRVGAKQAVDYFEEGRTSG
jgi:8-oxo-dGTP pyrophosphatase MutT (NUDIX family)